MRRTLARCISLIGLIAPGDPFEGGDGGDRPINIPSFMIDQATSNLLKAQIANGVVAGIDPADAINLAYTMVGSSSRGPRNHDGVIKPDVARPGASVSAIATSARPAGRLAAPRARRRWSPAWRRCSRRLRRQPAAAAVQGAADEHGRPDLQRRAARRPVAGHPQRRRPGERARGLLQQADRLGQHRR
jgi:hypothetical protein